MQRNHFSILINYFRYFLYLFVFYGFSICYAGSYDDFFIAIKRDSGSVVKELLQRGFDPNTLSPSGEHGLILAIREPSEKVISVLIQWPKTNIDSRTTKDESPLMLAALHGMTAVCLQLIDRDADVNKPGWTPLHYAATNGHIDVMNLLLEHSAYIDAESPNGSTPLMMAALYGTGAAVKLLLDAGADPMLKNIQGMTALDFAKRGDRLDAIELLTEAVKVKLPNLLPKLPKGTW
jgi:ankyrin repeat protein